MKNQIHQLLAYYNCVGRYSGKTRTMYVCGDQKDVKEAIIASKTLHSPAFELVIGH